MVLQFDNRKTLSVLGRTHVHLDFHTPICQPEVGLDFDGPRFAKRLKEANVDSVTVFGKCERGLSYYNTKVGTKHPHLKVDLLKEQVNACHEQGIRVLVYFSLALDDFAGINNPDWLAYDGNHKKLLRTPGWSTWVCYNSPYFEELVLPQIEEVLRYGVDGFWFDCMYMHYDACTCHYCTEIMRAAGIPNTSDNRRIYRTKTCNNVAERITRLIKNYNENLQVTYNPTVDLMGLQSILAKYESFITLGGHQAGWGYVHLPKYARYVRNLDRPVFGMVGIFNISWGDFSTVKHEAQFRYEISEILAHHFSVVAGDHIRPRGELEKAKYDQVIGKAFKVVKELSLPSEAEPVRDIAVVFPGTGDWGRYLDLLGSPRWFRQTDQADGLNGASKLLCDTHQQFDVLDENMVLSHIEKFKLIVLPEAGKLRPKTVDAIRLFVKNGGSLLATWDSSLIEDSFALGDVLGVSYRGRLPFLGGYIKLNDYDKNVPDIELNSYGGFLSVISNNAIVKAFIVAPIAAWEIRLVGYRHGPPERSLDAPAITYNKYGKGEVIYVSTALFTQYYAKNYHGHRNLLNNLITSLQKVRMVDADAPTTVEINAMNTAEGMYVHLINYHADHGAGTLPRINNWPPPIDVTIRVYAPGKKQVVPVTDVKIDVDRDDNYLQIALKSIKTHEIVKIVS